MKKVLINRSSEQSKEYKELLEREGFQPISCPMIETVLTQNLSPIHNILDRLEEIDWVVFTSENAVRYFFQVAEDYGVKFYFYPNLKIATVGEKTKLSLEQLGYRTNFVPIQYTAEVLAENMDDVRGKNILIPRSALASNEYLEVFQKRAANPIPIELYNTQTVLYSKEELEQTIPEQVDYLTFTSPSTIKAFDANRKNMSIKLEKTQVVCIGPSTAKAAQQLGYTPAAVAQPHTIEGVVAAIKKLEENA